MPADASSTQSDGRSEPCEFCALGWPRCPACAELIEDGHDSCCPHCGDTKGHVSPSEHADFLALEAEVDG